MNRRHDGELMRQVTGEVKPRRADRDAVSQAAEIYTNIRVSDFMVRGLLALYGDAMEGIADIDGLRMKLAKDNPGLGTLLGQMELSAFEDVMAIVQDAAGRNRGITW